MTLFWNNHHQVYARSQKIENQNNTCNMKTIDSVSCQPYEINLKLVMETRCLCFLY